MAEITCLKELEERGILQEKDIVEFIIKEQVIRYKVQNTHLHNLKSEITGYNDEIFNILKINKWEIAEKTYKYEPINKKTHVAPNQWPEVKWKNHPLFTRLVAELYRIIEKRTSIY